MVPIMKDLLEIYRCIENQNLTKQQILDLLKDHLTTDKGIVLSYSGRQEPWQITKLIKPKTTRIIKNLSVGPETEQSSNMIIEGENLSSMITLYKYRGQVDLIVTDPPYNTGKDFRYNDNWDQNPDDQSLGNLVLPDDGSRHSKWLRFMAPRLYMMKEMLSTSGVIAICIDHRELYRLGILMDEIFGEKNRIGIINWQKSYAPKSDSRHLSTATEYVLVYARDIDYAKTGLEDRTEAMDSVYGNPDNDPLGPWDSGKTGGNPTASSGDAKSAYGIQSPFTGCIHYPGTNYWRSAKSSMKAWLEAWGSEYEEKYIEDNLTHVDKSGRTTKIKALVLKGCKFRDGKAIQSDRIIAASREAASSIYNRGQWPRLFFTKKGDGAPRLKTYLNEVKQGKVPMTFWASENFDHSNLPLNIDSTSWAYTESDHSQAGIKELSAIVGNHGFDTVKPLKLIKKIIHLWCKPDGLVLDPFAGSGTTGHAVLELNKETAAQRRFIIIEQGNTETGDHYAKTLTAARLKRVITGEWHSGLATPVPGAFRYIQVQRTRVDAKAVAALAREEMIDLLTTSYWNTSDRSKSYLTRSANSDGYLFATNSRGEGFFLIWSPGEPSSLTSEAYDQILAEAASHNLAGRFHVYAATAPYISQKVEFYKIPDRVLEHLGFNSSNDNFIEGR